MNDLCFQHENFKHKHQREIFGYLDNVCVLYLLEVYLYLVFPQLEKIQEIQTGGSIWGEEEDLPHLFSVEY